MQIAPFSFETIDWSSVQVLEQPGITGLVRRRVKMLHDIRVRLVEYSAGYSADHWCEKGHVLHCLEGALETELGDGRTFRLEKGMTYLIGDNSEPHRSSSANGCVLFIVD